MGSYSKPSHTSLPLSIGERHIKEYLKKNRGRKRKLIKPQQEKARHEEWMKRGKVIVREKLVAGYWELIPMKSGDVLLAPHDTATVMVAEERRLEKKQKNNWWTEANWSRLKEALVNSRYPTLRGQSDEVCLELGFDPVYKQTLFNVLRRIGRKRITYDNFFPVKNRSLLSEM